MKLAAPDGCVPGTPAPARAPGDPHAAPGRSYARHKPEASDLYQIVQQELETFLSSTAVRERPVPRFVNTPKTIADDPQFRDRFPWYAHERHGADMLPFPVRFLGETLPEPSKAPTVGEHSEVVLGELLGHDAARIANERLVILGGVAEPALRSRQRDPLLLGALGARAAAAGPVEP